MIPDGSDQGLLTNNPAEDYFPNWGAPAPIAPPTPVS